MMSAGSTTPSQNASRRSRMKILVRSALGEGGLVSLGILVVSILATIAGNNKNTKDVSHDG
jgi:hypothetical protein